MREESDRGMIDPTDIPTQLVGDAMPIPTTGLLQPIPSGFGDLLRPHTSRNSTTTLVKILILTRVEMERIDDEFLNFEMLFRKLPCWRRNYARGQDMPNPTASSTVAA